MRLRLLGLPPSTNNLYAIVRGHQILSAEGRRFKAAIATIARELRAGLSPHDGPIALRISYRLRHDRDVDGSHKALLDALSGILYHDDRQVIALDIDKQRVKTGEPAELRLTARLLGEAPLHRPLPEPDRGVIFRTDLLPPSTNNTYAVIGRIRRLTREGRTVKDAYATALAGITPAPLAGPLRVRVRYSFAADRRDVDGSHKLLLDAARGILWSDDRQIVSIDLIKGRVPAGDQPQIELAVWETAR